MCTSSRGASSTRSSITSSLGRRVRIFPPCRNWCERINPTTCSASGTCGRRAPSAFANRDEDGGFVRVLDENPPQPEWAAAREAEELCPSATIRLQGD